MKSKWVVQLVGNLASKHPKPWDTLFKIVHQYLHLIFSHVQSQRNCTMTIMKLKGIIRQNEILIYLEYRSIKFHKSLDSVFWHHESHKRKTFDLFSKSIYR
jgi:hypothetical protein